MVQIRSSYQLHCFLQEQLSDDALHGVWTDLDHKNEGELARASAPEMTLAETSNTCFGSLGYCYRQPLDRMNSEADEPLA